MPNKYHSLELDLEKNYKDFFHFALDLVKAIENDNKNLKFAVVNMQISLELFLKYYFLKKGKVNWLFSNQDKMMFKDFSIILNSFFSDKSLLVTRKKHLKNILDARNEIVHQGKSVWSDELADNLINTTLFIQNVVNREFNETLIKSAHNAPNNLQSNTIWKSGTENFAKNIAQLNNSKVYECWFCYSHSFIDKKIFTCDELDDEGFQCVTCLNSLYTDYQIGIAKCICGDNSFVLDCLNPQKNGQYNGRCLNCNISCFAYLCNYCKKYFLDFNNERIIDGTTIFCSEKCKVEQKTTHKSRQMQ